MHPLTRVKIQHGAGPNTRWEQVGLVAHCRGRVAARRYSYLREHPESAPLVAQLLQLAQEIYKRLMLLAPKASRKRSIKRVYSTSVFFQPGRD